METQSNETEPHQSVMEFRPDHTCLYPLTDSKTMETWAFLPTFTNTQTHNQAHPSWWWWRKECNSGWEEEEGGLGGGYRQSWEAQQLRGHFLIFLSGPTSCDILTHTHKKLGCIHRTECDISFPSMDTIRPSLDPFPPAADEGSLPLFSSA